MTRIHGLGFIVLTTSVCLGYEDLRRELGRELGSDVPTNKERGSYNYSGGGDLHLAFVSTSQGNPAVQGLISKAVKKGLLKHNSEDTAWRSEKSEDKEKKVSFDVPAPTFRNPGRTRRVEKVVAKWTEEAKTWVWLDDPTNNLSVNVTQFEIRNDTVTFGCVISAKVKVKAWGKVPNVVEADLKSSANAEIVVSGSARVQNNRLSDAKVGELKGKVTDLRFNNDALKVVQGLIQDSLNLFVETQRANFKGDLEGAINEVSF